MARETMKAIQGTVGKISQYYDMNVKNMQDIHRASHDDYDLIINSFRFGYAQGMKAARAEMKKGQGVA